MKPWDEISAELDKPLDKAHVKPPKQYGPKGHYIEAWHAQAEANRIFGFDGWSQEVIAVECVMQSEREIGQKKDPGWGVTYTAKVRIVVGNVTREDFGAGHGYDRDLGQAHESAVKEAVSDAMKRALKAFGNPFGLALYDKTQANVTDTAEIERQALHAQKVTDSNVLLEAAKTGDELRDARAKVMDMWGGDPPDDVVATFRSQVAKLKSEAEGEAA